MKEENKYYTPEIEEFHVGFEFEVNYINPHHWGKEIFGVGEKAIHGVPQLLHQFLKGKGLKGNIRVKYLDREDIESLGFEQIDYDTYKKDDMYFEFNNEHKTYIWTKKSGLESNLFVGTIKNKSEFKRILKQIGL